jgi:hypothetical protein
MNKKSAWLNLRGIAQSLTKVRRKTKIKRIWKTTKDMTQIL